MIELISENNELKHRKFGLPDGIRKHLEKIKGEYTGDKMANGYKRLTNILDMNGIAYSEMKRIKNFFDHYTGSVKSMEFILNGGEEMKTWVNNTLGTATKAVHDYKQAMKDAGVHNAFRKPHEKDRQKRKDKPTQVKFQTNNATQSLLNGEIMKYENISREQSLNENNILKYIPKKVYTAIQKLNDAVKQQKEYVEDEYCLMERDGYEYSLSPIIINDKGEMEYDLVYNDYKKTHYHETIALVREYEGEFWFDDDEFKEYIKQYKSDLKRYMKYFTEYGSKESDYEDGGEERVMNRINNESKQGYTFIIDENQLKYIKQTIY